MHLKCKMVLRVSAQRNTNGWAQPTTLGKDISLSDLVIKAGEFANDLVNTQNGRAAGPRFRPGLTCGSGSPNIATTVVPWL
jgi:hypothetical protein